MYYIYILDIYILYIYIHIYTYIYIYIIAYILYIYIKFLPFKFSAAITPSDHAPCRSDRTRQTRLSQVHHILRGGTIQTNAESGHKLHLSQVWSIRTRLQILTQKHGCSNLLTWLVLSSYTPDTDKLWRQRKAFGMHFGKWKYATSNTPQGINALSCCQSVCSKASESNFGSESPRSLLPPADFGMMQFAFNSVCQQLHLYPPGPRETVASPIPRKEMKDLRWVPWVRWCLLHFVTFSTGNGSAAKFFNGAWSEQSRILTDSYHLRTARHYRIIRSSCLQSEPWSESIWVLSVGGFRDVVSFILRRNPGSWVS